MLGIISNHYFLDYDQDQYIDESLEKLVSGLDEYSHYFSAEQTIEREQKTWKGILYGGIGVNIFPLEKNMIGIISLREGYGLPMPV